MELKALPGIDRVLALPAVERLAGTYTRDLAAQWSREVVEELREQLKSGAEFQTGPDGKVSDDVLARRVQEKAAETVCPSLKRVVNATGIVIHTNLGRSPLSPYLLDAIKDLLGSYSNLEFDLEAGKRGSRHSHLKRLITAVTGAENGFVVNNNAAAVLVTLNTLARGREVIVSRGELIEIGGSFRIPDIIERGGAKLREVGTTNKTRIADYARSITSETALLLKVHTSNYKITGFTEEASLKELAELGAERGIPVMMDLGSGLLTDLSAYGISQEQPVKSYVETGADIITFSGDKMLGGPQAGFIVGRGRIVDDVQKNPMVRALRVGKLTLAALEAMLTAYLSPESLMEKIPALKLLTRDEKSLRASANSLARSLKKSVPDLTIEVDKDHNYAGGGSLPSEPLPTSVVILEAPGLDAETLAARLRTADIPVIGRIRSGRFCLDCRTVLPGDRDALVAALKHALGVPA